MSNPQLVEVTRGRWIESHHRGSIAIVDAEGSIALAMGQVDTPLFPRSAVKAIQALPLVEAGVVDRLGFGDKEIAMAVASHCGEPDHVATVVGMLAKVGMGADALECGAHWPASQAAALALAARGERPSSLHNTCSGKHAGYICLARMMEVDPSGYSNARHPVQKAVAGALEGLTGHAMSADEYAIDGCSVPTWPMPLAKLAHAFARFGTGSNLGAARSKAASRIRTACANQPWYVGGTGQFCSEVMKIAARRAFVKFGAEGVHCAALPEHGLGIALKCDDGAGRAAEVVMATLLAHYLDADVAGELGHLSEVPVRTWRGNVSGHVRPSRDLLMAISG